MSKETILLPSAKQILGFSQGDFCYSDVHDFYRFHYGKTFFWIEHICSKFCFCVRGFHFDNFYSSKQVLYSSVYLEDVISYFNEHVIFYLNKELRK